jgi:hypothetical protein
VTTPSRTASRRNRALKSIGLWGATQCGKTTFLASLYIAVNRSSHSLNIFGADDTSTEFLVESNRMLTKDHRFPEGTLAVNSYSWTMNMTQVVQEERTRFGQTTPPVTESSQFNIDMRDAPGGFFDSIPMMPQGQSRLDLGDGSPDDDADDPDDMLDHLAGCEGILLLIDPVRERQEGDAHEFFQGTLLRIAQRRMALMPPGSKLPHYVAVCITKFDDPEVYRFARMNGFRTIDDDDPYMFPRVHSDDAESFFRELCNSDMSDADLICNGLQNFFHPERVRFFVTSAIGFYLKGGRFREDDHQNAMRQEDGTFRIRGQIHPINVLEPILWLGQSVTA